MSEQQSGGLGGCIVAIALMVGVGVCSSRQSEQSWRAARPAAPPVTPRYSSAEMLAALDGFPLTDGTGSGSLLPKATDMAVRQYQAAMNSIARKTNGSQSEIADCAVTAQKYIRTKSGKRETLLFILENVDHSVPESMAGAMTTTEVFAVFAAAHSEL